MPANTGVLLQLDRISKSFFGVQVLQDISLSLERGRTLGLVGENGAGKSTLVNILGGNHQPDTGRMFLEGRPYSPRHPQDATRLGIAFIHQELNLFNNLSIAENIFIDSFPQTGVLPLIRRKVMRQRTAHLLNLVGLAVSPDTLVENLSPAERQLVEIAKALSRDARLIILDEPTTSLTAQESQRLFDLMAQLRSQRVSLIYISHNLQDVLRLCDTIVVLRDGQQVASGATPGFTLQHLVSLMVGRSITQLFPPRPTSPTTELILEAHGLSQPGILKDISFALHRGEILGLAGLMGSGRSELARILFGLDPCSCGVIRYAGQTVRPSPARNVRSGLAFLTENRREEGLCLNASIADNLALVSLPAHASPGLGWLNRPALTHAVQRMRQAVRLAPSTRLNQPARTLSGGNQQKVALAKWLLNDPSLLILDEPTRGVDVGARTEIYHLINSLSAQGAGILIISSEIEELVGLCDRILVMSRGMIRSEFHRAEFDRERILQAALHERAPSTTRS